jgi:hypothetical protein
MDFFYFIWNFEIDLFFVIPMKAIEFLFAEIGLQIYFWHILSKILRKSKRKICNVWLKDDLNFPPTTESFYFHL